MKPLESNPFDGGKSKNEEAKREIKEFINHPCEFAELAIIEDVTSQTNKERYKRACRMLDVPGIEIRATKGRIIACKTLRYYDWAVNAREI